MAEFTLTIRDLDPNDNDGNDLFVESKMEPEVTPDTQESDLTPTQYLGLSILMFLGAMLEAAQQGSLTHPDQEPTPTVVLPDGVDA